MTESLPERPAKQSVQGKLRTVIRVSQRLTLAGAVMAIASMVKMTNGLSGIASLFTAWVLLPFALAFLALAMRPSSLVGVLAVLSSSLFAVLVYFDLLAPRAHLSSTAGLAFLFIPLWQTAWCVCGIAIALGVNYRRNLRLVTTTKIPSGPTL